VNLELDVAPDVCGSAVTAAVLDRVAIVQDGAAG
jgi:hypothetical protein